MSTIKYPLNGKDYQIGTIGWEGPKSLSQLPDAALPTYGLWAIPAPEWSANQRAPRGSATQQMSVL